MKLPLLKLWHILIKILQTIFLFFSISYAYDKWPFYAG